MREPLLSQEAIEDLSKTVSDFSTAISEVIGDSIGEVIALSLLELENNLRPLSTQVNTTKKMVGDLLLKFPLGPALRQKLAQPPFEIDLKPQDVETHTRKSALAFTSSSFVMTRKSTEFKGENFLQEVVASGQGKVKNAFIQDESFNLQNQLALLKHTIKQSIHRKITTFEEENLTYLVDFLFFLFKDDAHNGAKRKPGEESLRRMTQLLQFQCEYNPNFLIQLAKFLGIYADVCNRLLNSGGFKDPTKQTERMVGFLRDLLRHPNLVVDPKVNLHEVHRQIWAENPENHPWVMPDSTESMFGSGAGLAKLVTRDIPRELLANALLMINKHPLPILVSQIQDLNRNITRETEDNIPPKTKSKINTLHAVAEPLDVIPRTKNKQAQQKGPPTKTNLGDLRRVLSDNKALIQPVTPEGSEMAFIGYEALLRTIEPENIVHSHESQQRFLMMLKIIRTKAAKYQQDYPERKKKLTEDLRKAENVNDKKKADLIRYQLGLPEKCANPILARSIFEVLSDTNPALDVPLEKKGLATIRIAVAQLAYDVLPEEMLLNGPYCFFPERKKPMLDQSVIPPIETNSLNWEPKNFTTAKLGMTRDFLHRAARATIKHLGYDGALTFINKEFQKHFKASNYDPEWYVSASAAIGDFAGRYSAENPNVPIHVYFSNQEYEDVIAAFTKAGAEPGQAIYIADKQGNTKPVEEMATNFANQIIANYEANPEAKHIVILSCHTRFGTAPMSRKTSTKKHLDDLNRFFEKVKAKATAEGIPEENIVTITDAAQSVGRDNPESGYKSDVILFSFGKAMGAGRCGCIAYQQPSPERKKPIIKSEGLQGTAGTRPVENFVASAIAMRYLRSRFDFWKGYVQDESSEHMSMRGKWAKHMQELTTYAIEKVQSIGLEVAQTHKKAFSDIIQNSIPIKPKEGDLETISPEEMPKVASILNWNITTPNSDQKRSDYIGILTISVPGISGNSLVSELKSKGYQVEHFSPSVIPGETKEKGDKDHSIRISFHYLHEKANVDELFRVIGEVQMNNLWKRNKGNRIISIKQLQSISPSVRK